jgi:hypothetical protein
MTPFGTYCYLRMPEALYNVGPTFCRMTKAALKDQISINMFSYIDDIVVASRKKDAYISDLVETFMNMHEANPDKIRGIDQQAGRAKPSVLCHT